MSPSKPSPRARVRPAAAADAPAIVALIELNVASGELLPRTEEFVRLHLEHFIVAEEDGTGRIIGCVHLDEYAPSLAEVRSLAVAPDAQGMGIGGALTAALERLAAVRSYTTLFAVSNSGEFFRRRGYEERHIPELDRERSSVSRYKGVHAKDLGCRSGEGGVGDAVHEKGARSLANREQEDLTVTGEKQVLRSVSGPLPQ